MTGQIVAIGGGGVSAGMNCWFESSTTDSFGLTLQPLADGLGFLPGWARPQKALTAPPHG